MAEAATYRDAVRRQLDLGVAGDFCIIEGGEDPNRPRGRRDGDLRGPTLFGHHQATA
jgi:hypothetical protein